MPRSTLAASGGFVAPLSSGREVAAMLVTLRRALDQG
jgi:hypothetical protein